MASHSENPGTGRNARTAAATAAFNAGFDTPEERSEYMRHLARQRWDAPICRYEKRGKQRQHRLKMGAVKCELHGPWTTMCFFRRPADGVLMAHKVPSDEQCLKRGHAADSRDLPEWQPPPPPPPPQPAPAAPPAVTGPVKPRLRDRLRRWAEDDDRTLVEQMAERERDKRKRER
ncbi:MAG: hypothetical protein GEV09_15565 [Pseudonocardiaceae bacterium]|nr:hypothetical protein [Pseudonocardiaceae bacterium]